MHNEIDGHKESTQAGQLPPELWITVVEFTDETSWPQLALINPTFRAAAERLLYDFIDLTERPPPVVVSCLQTFTKRPVLGYHVRSFAIGRVDPSEYYTASFFRLLKGTLRCMPNLKMLYIRFFAPLARCLSDTPSRLNRFVCYCIWDERLSAWLEEQPSLKIVDFRGFYTRDQPEVRSGIVQDLCHVSGSPTLIRTLVPGRPVHSVEVHFPPLLPFDPAVMAEVAQAITQSTRPVQHLAVYIDRHMEDQPPLIILELLRMVPRHMPCLDELAVHIVGGDMYESFLQGLGGIMMLFEHLRKITVSSDAEDDLIHDAQLGPLIASMWHYHCRTLKAVSLPSGGLQYLEGTGWRAREEVDGDVLKKLTGDGGGRRL